MIPTGFVCLLGGIALLAVGLIYHILALAIIGIVLIVIGAIILGIELELFDDFTDIFD